MNNPFKGFCRPSVLAALVLAGMGGQLPALAGVAHAWPSLGDAANPERHPGKMIWADLVTPDLAAAERFYGGLFGWTFESFHTGAKDCVLASVHGHPLGFLLQRPLPPGEPRQPVWLTFFAVKDVDAARALALREGATALRGPMSFEGHGRQAVFTDPEGAVFGMLASSSGDPADFLAAPGEWYWCSLMAPDPALDAAFYQKVFDYEVFTLPSEGTAEHLILATDDLARSSVNSMPGVVARPRAPSGMKSAFLSNLFHALRAGERFTCPVGPEATVWLQSLTMATRNLVHALAVPASALPRTRALTLPALRLAMGDLVRAVADDCGADPALVTYAPDPALQAGFGNQPPLITPAAEHLGFARDADPGALVRGARP